MEAMLDVAGSQSECSKEWRWSDAIGGLRALRLMCVSFMPLPRYMCYMYMYMYSSPPTCMCAAGPYAVLSYKKFTRRPQDGRNSRAMSKFEIVCRSFGNESWTCSPPTHETHSHGSRCGSVTSINPSSNALCGVTTDTSGEQHAHVHAHT